MRAGKTNNLSQFIVLRGDDWYQKQKIAGLCVAKCLKTCKKLIEDKIPNLNAKDLENECEKIFNEFECLPTFYGYKGFPSKICFSENEKLVHGIVHDYTLKEGDVVSIDLGATYQGVIADAAITTIYGKPKDINHLEMINKCKQLLFLAIEAIKPGKRIGIIGETIYNAHRDYKFGLITDYGGHSISMTEDGQGIPHAAPFVSNKASADEGVHLETGMTLAIEPLLCMGKPETTTLEDGWTVVMKDRGVAAHFEITTFITATGAEVMTPWHV